MSDGQVIAVIILGLLGSILCVFGYGQLFRSIQLVRRGVRTTGMVVGHESEEDWDAERRERDVSYFPVVEFTDIHGVKRRKRLSLSTTRPDGFPVPLLYDPGHVDQAEIDSFSFRWIPGLSLATIGTIILVVAALVMMT